MQSPFKMQIAVTFALDFMWRSETGSNTLLAWCAAGVWFDVVYYCIYSRSPIKRSSEGINSEVTRQYCNSDSIWDGWKKQQQDFHLLFPSFPVGCNIYFCCSFHRKNSLNIHKPLEVCKNRQQTNVTVCYVAKENCSFHSNLSFLLHLTSFHQTCTSSLIRSVPGGWLELPDICLTLWITQIKYCRVYLSVCVGEKLHTLKSMEGFIGLI